MTRAIVRLLAWAGFLALLAGTRFFSRAPYRTGRSGNLSPLTDNARNPHKRAEIRRESVGVDR